MQWPLSLKYTSVGHAILADTNFKVKGQLAGRGGILWRPPAQLIIIIIICEQCETLHY